MTQQNAEIFSSGGLQPCPWLPASENLWENSSEPQPATPLGSSSYLGSTPSEKIHQHFLAVFKNVQNLCRPLKKCD